MLSAPDNVYATPTSKADHHSFSQLVGPYGKFLSNRILKSIIVWMLILNASLTVLNGGLLNYWDIKQVQDSEYLAPDGLSDLNSLNSIARYSHAVLYLGLILVFCVWINRSCKNAWLLNRSYMSITPGWAVGYFFMPILMLWRPYTAMKEIRNASYRSKLALRGILPLWWTLWLATNFLNYISTKLFNSPDLERSLMGSKIELYSLPAYLLLDYIAIVIVSGITLAQIEQSETRSR